MYDKDFREVENVMMCDECRTKSGYGQLVGIAYRSTGGWSPRWEGRVCEHIQRLSHEDFVAKLKNYYGGSK